MNLTRPPAHLPTCKGLTLLELVIVLFLMTLSIFLIAQTFGNNLDQKRYERTLESMGEIKKAILGTHSKRVRGDIKFAGYVPDMGDLPELVNGQPRGLWTKDVKNTPDDKDDDLPFYRTYNIGQVITKLTISLGWHGPYLKPPPGGILKDGWKNPFVFETKGRNFITKSMGADGNKGGTGYDEDISVIINENDWLGCVAGYISPYSVFKTYQEAERAHFKFRKPDRTEPTNARVCIFYSPKNCNKEECNGYEWASDNIGSVHAMDIETGRDGYFYFDGVPIGTERLLLIAQPVAKWRIPIWSDTWLKQPYKIDIEPGINWLGNMGNIP